MFNNIAGRYDLLNRVLSAGIDLYWRKKAIDLLVPKKPRILLDVATGTADFALEAMRLKPEKIVGVDISEGMMEVGRKKISERNLTGVISLQYGDSENLPFEEGTFDAVIVSFGVRNFENLEQGLRNIYRVLKKNGTLIVLEFSTPEKAPFKQLYQFYLHRVLPLIGKTVSKDTAAYEYLPESVAVFPYGRSFTRIMDTVGFGSTRAIPLTFGICSIYEGTKPA